MASITTQATLVHATAALTLATHQGSIGEAVAAAAEAAMVSVATINRWRNNPTFARMVEDCRKEVNDGVTALVVGRELSKRAGRVAELEDVHRRVRMIAQDLYSQYAELMAVNTPAKRKEALAVVAQARALWTEQRNILDAIAEQMGHKVTKIDLNELTNDQLMAILAEVGDDARIA